MGKAKGTLTSGKANSIKGSVGSNLRKAPDCTLRPAKTGRKGKTLAS